MISNGQYECSEWKLQNENFSNEENEMDLSDGNIGEELCNIFDRLCFMVQVAMLIIFVVFIVVYYHY